LHQEKILVVSGAAVDRRIALQMGHLHLTLQSEETGEPLSRASVALVLSGEAAGKKISEWRDLPSYTKLRSRDSKVESRDVRPGTYSYAVSGTGLTETKGEVTVMAGDNNVPTAVKVKKGDGKDSNARSSQMFGSLDKNGDGMLSKEELGRLADRVTEADTNGDGLISKEEMDAWSKKRQAERETERASRGGQGGQNAGGAAGSTRGGRGGTGQTGTGRGGGSTGRGGGTGRGR
jgi:hypothetical protein